MGIISQISLAQAQECIMEKSILDNRKPTIISKVGKLDCLIIFNLLKLWSLSLYIFNYPDIDYKLSTIHS